MLASRFVRVPPSRVPSLSVSGDLSAEGRLTQGLGGSIFMLEPRHAGSVVSAADPEERSEEHTSELQSLMRISYAVFCWKKKRKHRQNLERARMITTIRNANSLYCELLERTKKR